MKLSISMPDEMAQEIKLMAKETERNISWWLQRAWLIARPRLLNRQDDERARKKALKKLASLRGSLKKEYPGLTSVRLSRRAFEKR